MHPLYSFLSAVESDKCDGVERSSCLKQILLKNVINNKKKIVTKTELLSCELIGERLLFTSGMFTKS